MVHFPISLFFCKKKKPHSSKTIKKHYDNFKTKYRICLVKLQISTKKTKYHTQKDHLGFHNH